MTSKISYFKFIESDIRRRGWLAALSAVLLFLILPVYTLLSIDSVKNQPWYKAGSGDFQSWASGTFPGFFNGSTNRYFAVLIVILAILCAVTGFSYLHTRDKQDFYHSMPVRRVQWFAVSYWGGLIIFLVPYLLFALSTLLIGQAHGILNREILLTAFTSVLGGVLGFLICYHTSILAMFLTGRIVTGVLASFVLLIYGNIIMFLMGGLASKFFHTWTSSSPAILQEIVEYMTPATLYMRTLRTTTLRPSSPAVLICAVLCAVILIAAALLIYKYYPAEAAENALAFSKSAPVIKILIAVPTALFIGLFIDSFSAGSGSRWIISFSILTVILLCLLIEFIYHQDIRQILSGKASTALSLCAVAAILCILQFDLFGYDTYLPKEKKLAEMSVYTDNFSGYFDYPESYEGVLYDQLNAPAAAITDYETLYRLSEEGIENLKQGITPQFINQGDSSQDAVVVTMRFGLTNGKNVYRQYAVDKTALLSAMKQACESEAYRKELFPVFHLNPEDILGISMQDIYYKADSLSLSRKEQNQLIDAYKEDVLSADIAELQNEAPLGELIVDFPDKYAAEPVTGKSVHKIQLGQFYVYRSYTNTLQLLEEHGYKFRTKISPNDVALMTYYPNEGTDDVYTQNADLGYSTIEKQKSSYDYSFGDGIPVTSPEEIQKLLDQISYDECSGLLGNYKTTTGSVEITLNGKAYPNTYAVYGE